MLFERAAALLVIVGVAFPIALRADVDWADYVAGLLWSHSEESAGRIFVF